MKITPFSKNLRQYERSVYFTPHFYKRSLAYKSVNFPLKISLFETWRDDVLLNN